MLTVNVESISEVAVVRCSGRIVRGHETALQAAGVYLKLLNPSRQVREILKVTRLNSIFEICESQSVAETKQSMQEGRPGNQFERFTFASSPNA